MDAGGDALGTAIGAMLGDYFTTRFGSLASISLVRCGLSDEGATAVARGIWASSGLNHVDLSGLISETHQTSGAIWWIGWLEYIDDLMWQCSACLASRPVPGIIGCLHA